VKSANSTVVHKQEVMKMEDEVSVAKAMKKNYISITVVGI
jgi:hypothetical protein